MRELRLVTIALAGGLWCAPLFAQGPLAGAPPVGADNPATAQLYQPPDSRPARGRQTLTASAAVYGGYDGIDNRDQGAFNGLFFQQLGRNAGAQLGLTYGRQWRRSHLTVRGSSQHGYYPELSKQNLNAYGGHVAFDTEVGRRWQLFSGVTARYAPAFTLAFGPAVHLGPENFSEALRVEPVDFGLAIAPQASRFYAAGGSAVRSLGPRTSLRLSAGTALNDFVDPPAAVNRWADMYFWSVGGSVHHSLGRGLTARAGYGYGQARLAYAPDGRIASTHTIDIGVDYGRALSLSRRTYVSFKTGSGFANRQFGDDTLRPNAAVQGFFLARASVVHRMGRTWRASLSYSRDLVYLDGLLDPTLATWVSATAGGTLGRRAGLWFTGSYSNGRVGMIPMNGYNLLAASAGVRVGLTRRAAMFSQVLVNSHDFGTEMPLPPGFARQFDRYSARIGVSLLMPVIR